MLTPLQKCLRILSPEFVFLGVWLFYGFYAGQTVQYAAVAAEDVVF